MFDIFISVILPIFIVILVGALYGAKHRIQIDNINQINMDIFTPALVVSALLKPFPDDIGYGTFVLAAALIVIIPGILTLPLLKLFNWRFKTIVPTIMFRNSGNLGIPLLVFAFGSDILPIAIMLFLIENTLHFSLGMLLIQGRINPFNLLKIPILQATIIGLSLAFFEVSLPLWISRFLDLIGQVAIPLMLFTLGVRLLDVDFKAWRFGLMGTAWSFLSGLFAFLSAYFVLDLTKQQVSTLFIFALLPPAVLNYLVAERYNIEPAKVATLVLFANVFCILWLIPALDFTL